MMWQKKAGMISGILVLTAAGGFTGVASAAEKTAVYTIQKSIDEAVTKNYSLKARQEKIGQAIEVKNQARTDFLPKFSVSYSYTRLDEAQTIKGPFAGPAGEIPIGTINNYKMTGTVIQPVFTGFSLISSYRLAQLGIDQSEMNLELEKLDLALNVKTAYYNILISEKGIEVAQKAVESLESNLNVASNFHKVGMIPINDVLKAEVELANSRQNLVKAENAAKLSRASFNTVLARGVNEPVEVEDILQVKQQIEDFDTYREMALQDRPEVKVIDINILQADQQIRLAKSRYWPDISLQYNYIKQGDTLQVNGSTFQDPTQWQAIAVAQWTFWEWGKTLHSAREKENFKQELMETKNALVDNIALQVKQAMLELLTAAENIPTTQKAVEQGEENLRVNEERYKAQVTTITEVLDAQTLLTQARVNYFTSLYNYGLARAKLDRAIGTY
jgi:outer membrane protein